VRLAERARKPCLFSDGFPKGPVVRQTRRIEGGEIQIHTLILGQAITSLNAFGG
jgi:hypothetical protein